MRNADDMGLPPPDAVERLSCPGLAARVDELEAALQGLMSAARAAQERSGGLGMIDEDAWARARRALSNVGEAQ